MKCIACLFLLFASVGFADEDPPYNIYDGPAQTGAFRASILGASNVFAAIPVGSTTTINGFELHYKAGDRITVSDATTFYVYDGTIWRPLLSDYHWNLLDKRFKNLETDPSEEGETIIIYLGNNLFEAYTYFTEPTRTWFVPFPEGKGINAVGIASIGGFPFHSLGKIVYGYGGIQTGIQYSLAEDEYWPPGTFAIARFMVKDVLAATFVTSASTDVIIPSTLPSEQLGILEF